MTEGTHPLAVLCVAVLPLGLLISAAAGSLNPQASEADIARSLHVADELERERAFDAARRQLQAVAEHASSHQAAALRLRICALWTREGHREAAWACYDGLAGRLEDPEQQALAAYHAAALTADAGKNDAAIDRLARILSEFPQTDAAERGLALWRDLVRSSEGSAGEVELLLRVSAQTTARRADYPEQRLPKSHKELAAGALVAAAQLLMEDGQRLQRAGEILKEAEELAQGTSWLDDVRYFRARLMRRTGNKQAAVAIYHSLLDTLSSSWFMGSYNSQYHDDALFEMAEVFEEQGRLDEAVSAYEDLQDLLPTSRLVDDAMFRAARIEHRRGRTDAMQRFADAFTESRHRRAALELLETQ